MNNNKTDDLNKPIQAIFPDTNIFLPAWPSPSAGLSEVAGLAAKFGIPVYLCEAVAIELENHCIREAKANYGRLPAFLKAAVAKGPIHWPDIISSLQRDASMTKEAIGLLPAPFPSMDVKHFFESAARHDPPFGPGSKNFLDAVILESILQFSQGAGLQKIAFLSKNRADFNSELVRNSGRRFGIHAVYYKDPAELEKTLTALLERADQAQLKENGRQVLELLNSRIDDLTSFLERRFIFPEADLRTELRLLAIESVKVGVKSGVEDRSSWIPFTAIVDVLFTMSFKDRTHSIDRGVSIEGWANLADGPNIELESSYISR